MEQAGPRPRDPQGALGAGPAAFPAIRPREARLPAQQSAPDIERALPAQAQQGPGRPDAERRPSAAELPVASQREAAAVEPARPPQQGPTGTERSRSPRQAPSAAGPARRPQEGRPAREPSGSSRQGPSNAGQPQPSPQGTPQSADTARPQPSPRGMPQESADTARQQPSPQGMPQESADTALPQPSPQGPADGGRSQPDAGPSARGEHTHSEVPIPGPRALEPGGGEPAPQGRQVLQRSSVRGQILDALRAALAAGELSPGEVYSAPALGERFGVSATPVREAMQQLAREGAVEVVPNRGFRVVRRGARELAELNEVRALIEVPVVQRLARTACVDDWDDLRPLAEDAARAASSGCRARYAEADRAFHRAVLALAGNEQLVQIADDLHRRTQPPAGGPATSSVRTELMADAAEHIALLDALCAQDLETVEALVDQHWGRQ